MLWADPVGPSLFRIRALPTFADDISLFDIVHVSEFDDRLFVDDIVEESGHSTLRVILFDNSAHDRLLQICKDANCLIAHTEIPGLFAIDVSPEQSLVSLLRDLQSGRETGMWDMDEASVARHQHTTDS